MSRSTATCASCHLQDICPEPVQVRRGVQCEPVLHGQAAVQGAAADARGCGGQRCRWQVAHPQIEALISAVARSGLQIQRLRAESHECIDTCT